MLIEVKQKKNEQCCGKEANEGKEDEKFDKEGTPWAILEKDK